MSRLFFLVKKPFFISVVQQVDYEKIYKYSDNDDDDHAAGSQ
jgi:hypothetical protein